jgi:serine/threonine-protein kinase
VSDDPRVAELLNELLETGSTPEAVCADCPELLPEVRRRWEQMRRVKADLDALFPAQGAQHDTNGSGSGQAESE